MQEFLNIFADIVERTYALLDQIGLSVAGLVALAVVFGVLLLLGLREAVTWFFKIDDVKKDLRRIRESLNEVEGELRALQTIIDRGGFKTSGANTNLEAALNDSPTDAQPAKPAPAKAPSFPVVH